MSDPVTASTEGKPRPAWSERLKTPQAIFAIVASTATILAAGYTFFSMPRGKMLALEYVTKIPLLADSAGASTPKLAVTFDGKAVKNPYVMRAWLRHIGGTAIQSSDVETPVTLPISNAEVLAASIFDRTPKDVSASLGFTLKNVTLSTKLLQPEEAVGIEILTDGDPGWPVATARISGVRGVTTRAPGMSKYSANSSIFYFMYFLINSFSTWAVTSFVMETWKSRHDSDSIYAKWSRRLLGFLLPFLVIVVALTLYMLCAFVMHTLYWLSG